VFLYRRTTECRVGFGGLPLTIKTLNSIPPVSARKNNIKKVYDQTMSEKDKRYILPLI
jgi:hypothetical protein